MTDDLFDDGVSADDFALPGDAEKIARITGDVPAGDAPEPVVSADAGPARGEDGRFVARQAAEPLAETQAVAEPEFEPEPISIDGVLEKFGIDPDTADEAALKLARSYAELQQFNGRRSSELGELRAQLAEHGQSAEQSDTSGDLDVQGWLLENPAEILGSIQQAWADGDDTLLAHGLVALDAVDPVQAEALRIEIARKSVGATEARAEAQQEHEAVFAAGAEAHPGLQEFVTSPVILDLAQEFPALGNSLAEGVAPQHQLEAILALQEIHQGRQHQQIQDAHRQVARSTAEQAQQMREEAFVASATSANSGVKLSRADQIAAEWDAMDAPYRDGWNV